MCGIAGLLATRPANEHAVAAMLSTMSHRGPDGDGVWTGCGGKVALGHRRLAVLHPGPGGAQPMVDSSGQVAITFNGEIYNYKELAQRLAAEGAVFSSGCDTEVLLQAYLHWGEACLQELNGMFAFCIIDERKGLAFCARDRFGEKPFLYSVSDGLFAFASEYKALLTINEVDDAIDEARVLGFMASPRRGLDDAGDTVFPAIRQLRGGECLRVDLNTLAVSVSRYWALAPGEAPVKSFDDAVAAFKDLLTDSVFKRLRSDVPVGSCLSGGLDSSAIVALARRKVGPDHPYHVFVGRFPGSPADEWTYGRAVAEHTQATVHMAEPTAEGFLGTLDDFLWLNELPVGSSSQFAQWTVFQTAKENGVTVLLDGQGSDEILGGYEQYFRAYLQTARPHGDAPAEEQAIRARYPQALAQGGEGLKKSLPPMVGRWLSKLTGKGSDFRFGVTRDFWTPTVSDGAKAFDSLRAALFEDSVEGFLCTLLRYGDRNSMAHSREVRLPFLDHRIAEFVFSLPAEYLMGDAATKRLLRAAMADELPVQIVERWNKQGFLPPQDDWMAGALAPSVRACLTDPSFAARGWWDAGWWRGILRRFEAGERHLAWVLWKPFMAERWMTGFVERARQREKVSAFTWA